MNASVIAIDDPAWSAFVAEHPSAGPLHLPGWTQLIAQCYRFRAFALVVREGDKIVAGAPIVEVGTRAGNVRWSSLPYSDYCPPLIGPGLDSDEVIEALRDRALAAGADDLEIRAPLPAGADRHRLEVGFRHVVELPADPSALHPRKNHRNARNKARRNGVTITRGASAQEITTYYRLHTLTRRRLGVPVQPRRFFDLIGDRMLASGHGFIATAILDGVAVASSLYLTHNGTILAKYGASDPNYLDSGAGYLIDWEIASAACLEGYHTLDFGRTDVGSSGLRLYKTGWGAIESPLVYTHVAHAAPRPTHRNLDGLTHGFIRRSPLWVCRMLGEMFYRGAA